MQLMTIFNLVTKRDSELRVIFREVSEQLVNHALPAHDKRNAIATLENIVRVMRHRLTP